MFNKDDNINNNNNYKKKKKKKKEKKTYQAKRVFVFYLDFTFALISIPVHYNATFFCYNIFSFI